MVFNYPSISSSSLWAIENFPPPAQPVHLVPPTLHNCSVAAPMQSKMSHLLSGGLDGFATHVNLHQIPCLDIELFDCIINDLVTMTVGRMIIHSDAQDAVHIYRMLQPVEDVEVVLAARTFSPRLFGNFSIGYNIFRFQIWYVN